jgi:hypothetical protein
MRATRVAERGAGGVTATRATSRSREPSQLSWQDPGDDRGPCLQPLSRLRPDLPGDTQPGARLSRLRAEPAKDKRIRLPRREADIPEPRASRRQRRSSPTLRPSGASPSAFSSRRECERVRSPSLSGVTSTWAGPALGSGRERRLHRGDGWRFRNGSWNRFWRPARLNDRTAERRLFQGATRQILGMAMRRTARPQVCLSATRA